MYRNFSSTYRRLYGYTTENDGGDSWDYWYRPRWYYNYTRPDYTSNWRLWDPLRWVEDVEETGSSREPTPTPTPTPASTPRPTNSETTPQPAGTTEPQPTTGSPQPNATPEPQPVGSPEPQPAGTPEPQPAGTPQPQPAGTPEPQPAATPQPQPAGTPEPQPAGTPQPQPAGTPEPQPAATPQPQPADTPKPQPAGTPEPQPAGTPEPQPAGTPQPEPTSGSPQPASGSEELPNETASELTEIVGVDLLTETNRVSHHTTAYSKLGLIIRRGQEFDVTITINKQWTKDDILRLQLSIGKRPHINYGTLLMISSGTENDLSEASAVIKDITNSDGGSIVRLSVNLARDSPVGEYAVVVIARKKEDKRRRFAKFLLREKIVVLFNSWCKADDVYIDNDDERNEYVMNESGRLYTSSSLWNSGKPWIYGQFQDSILDAALYLLDRSKLPKQACGNPVRVTRQMSAMVNSNDDSGVLSGNWSGDYSSGTSPTSWSGSVKILQEYMENKSPVKWGQCWVFSGVLTTVCRALGIPTRSVTNFESAHDSDESMTIDTFYDEDGNPLKYLNDSVWNFHVWNEAWFLRPDIPGDYGGWQAFDSTPQERSEYVFQCGPAPLKAIKEGNVHLGYDARFIFAEVNGDQITWTKFRDGTLKATERLTGEVGKHLSTKAVLKTERNIVTDLYKHKEGSDEERESVARAYQLSNRRRDLDKFYHYDEGDDVQMTFNPEMNDDGTVSFLFSAKNTASERRTLSCSFTAMATYYTGVTANELDKAKKRMILKSGKEKEFSWKMTAAKWINKAAEDATVGIYAYVRVKETGQLFAKKSVLELNKPELEITFDNATIRRGDNVVLTATFTNPLDLELTKCSLTVEGTGFKPVKEHLGDVRANDVISASVTLKSLMTGRQDINATFHSRQLVNISGSATLTVTD